MQRFVFAVVACVSLGAFAGERDFSATWTTQTLTGGHRDLETWLTPRIARADPQYTQTEFRFGLTAGLSDRVETQVLIDLAFTSKQLTDTTVDPRVTSLWRFTPFKSNDVVGFGMLARASLFTDVLDLEVRALLDKAVGRVLFALNSSVSHSFLWNGRTGLDTRLEESLGARFAVSQVASFGVESLAKIGFDHGAYQGTALYFGPVLAFRFKAAWVSLGLLAQVGADKTPADRGNGEPFELRDNERFVGRLAVGVHLD